MDQNEIDICVLDAVNRQTANPELRFGQAFMIAVCLKFPRYYQTLLNSDMDCFYDDRKFEKVCDNLRKI